MRDHHLVDYELQVLLELAGRREPLRRGAPYANAMETLFNFGFIRLDRSLTRDGIEVVDSVSPQQAASR